MIDSSKDNLKNKLIKENEELHSTKKVNKHSENLFERKKLKRFEDIFKILDSDNDGVINSNAIDIDQINPDILQIINELLIEMEEKGKSLDLKGFTIGMQKFYEYLASNDRTQLLNLKLSVEKEKDNKKDEHKPVINEFSKEIVENMRKSYGLSQIKNKWEERKLK